MMRYADRLGRPWRAGFKKKGCVVSRWKRMIRLSDARSVRNRKGKQHGRAPNSAIAAAVIFISIFSLRFALFGEVITWQTALVLAPVSEDALKLFFTLLLLIFSALAMRSSNATRRQLLISLTRFLFVSMPLAAGCLFTLLVEPHGVNRYLGHMASAGLGFAVCLFAWRRCRPLTGLLLGLAVGASVHSFLNTAQYWPLPPQGTYQSAAALVLLIAAVLALWCTSRQEPASDVASEFFSRRAWNGSGRKRMADRL
jgi:hypothetical protein